MRCSYDIGKSNDDKAACKLDWRMWWMLLGCVLDRGTALGWLHSDAENRI